MGSLLNAVEELLNQRRVLGLGPGGGLVLSRHCEVGIIEIIDVSNILPLLVNLQGSLRCARPGGCLKCCVVGEYADQEENFPRSETVKKKKKIDYAPGSVENRRRYQMAECRIWARRACRLHNDQLDWRLDWATACRGVPSKSLLQGGCVAVHSQPTCNLETPRPAAAPKATCTVTHHQQQPPVISSLQAASVNNTIAPPILHRPRRINYRLRRNLIQLLATAFKMSTDYW